MMTLVQTLRLFKIKRKNVSKEFDSQFTYKDTQLSPISKTVDMTVCCYIQFSTKCAQIGNQANN